MSPKDAQTRRLLVLLSLLACLILASRLAHARDDAEAPPDAAPAYSDRGADTCLMCHRDDATAAVFATPHGNPEAAHAPFFEGQLQCEACHGPGGAHAGRVPRGEARPGVLRFVDSEPAGQRNAPCLGCHAQDVATDWHASTHDHEALACSDCHSSHPVADAARDPADCSRCHRPQAAAARKPYSHGADGGAAGCLDCHAAHGGDNEFALQEPTVNETCFTCHAEKRGPFLWEHAAAVEDCTSCHDPHGANAPGMLVRRGPLLCQSCHAQAGHPSLPQTPTSGAAALRVLENCTNCHTQVHGSNHPSGSALTR